MTIVLSMCDDKAHVLNVLGMQMRSRLHLVHGGVADDKETKEIGNSQKITKIYIGLLKFMANIAVLLKSALGSGYLLNTHGIEKVVPKF